jgi:hypothetical protein
MLPEAFCAAGVLWFTLDLPKIDVLMQPICLKIWTLPNEDAQPIL